MLDLFLHMAFVMVGRQIGNNVGELVFPWVQHKKQQLLDCFEKFLLFLTVRYLKRWVNELSSKKNKRIMSRWEEDYVAPETERVSLFEEYLEMGGFSFQFKHCITITVTSHVLILICSRRWSAAVCFCDSFRGVLPARPSLRPPQQHRGDPPRRLQVHVFVATSSRPQSKHHRNLVEDLTRPCLYRRPLQCTSY